MKKLQKSFIAILVLFVLVSLFSCASIFYDANDSYYVIGSPYYHREHFYNDYYYDRGSVNYHRQHYSGYSEKQVNVNRRSGNNHKK